MRLKLAAVSALALLVSMSPAYAQEAAPATEAAPAAEVVPAAPAAQAASTPEAPAAAAPATGSLVGSPPEGKGQVVFFRPSKFVGAAISYKVREGETELGLLSNGRYFVVAADPGPHAYVVHSEVKDILNLEIEAGETYYAEGGVTVGILAGRPNLTPVDSATFDAVSAKLKLGKPLAGAAAPAS
ncbi:hypothetical protein BH11PSE1_BH11PSE1_18670 [soil metagenome]